MCVHVCGCGRACGRALGVGVPVGVCIPMGVSVGVCMLEYESGCQNRFLPSTEFVLQPSKQVIGFSNRRLYPLSCPAAPASF